MNICKPTSEVLSEFREDFKDIMSLIFENVIFIISEQEEKAEKDRIINLIEEKVKKHFFFRSDFEQLLIWMDLDLEKLLPNGEWKMAISYFKESDGFKKIYEFIEDSIINIQIQG